MRIGIVGTSWWTRMMHGPAARSNEDWDLTAIYGRSREKAQALASTFDCPATDDFDELLALSDALILAVPPPVQVELAIAAARAGKHLLLEKPLALDPAQGQAVVDAVEEAGVANLVFFTTLWVPDRAAWLDAAAASGGWVSGRYEHLVRLPEALVTASPWRAKSGALWDVGPHALSVLERVLGPTRTVAGLVGAGDLVHLTLHHGSGAISSAELTLTAPEGVNRTRYEFLGPEGHCSPESFDVPADPSIASRTALAELADQARTGRRGGPDARHGQHVVRVLAAAERALATNRTEQVYSVS